MVRIRVYPQRGFGFGGYGASPAFLRAEARAARRAMRAERRNVAQLRWMMARAAQPIGMPFAGGFGMGFNGMNPFNSFNPAFNGAGLLNPFGIRRFGYQRFSPWGVSPAAQWGFGRCF
jgi:hypothetical protein